MNRYYYLILIIFVTLNVWGQTELPVGNAPDPVEFTHFPSRLHTFVWRNWPLVPVEHLAEVVQTTPENIQEIALSMGIKEQNPIPSKYWNRIYITLIRRNWHLLPYNQLLKLLDMTPEELAHSLREDDFLYIKLGSHKPECEPLIYTPPTEQQKERCSEIQKIVKEHFDNSKSMLPEERFQFIEELSQIQSKPTQEKSDTKKRFSPRFVYSYFALYGDSLMDSNLESYPDGLLQRLSDMGVDGIWIHSVLRQMAPSKIFSEFGENHEIRLKNLNALVKRAKKYGIKIFLYVNEPRAMPEEFFVNRENMKGVSEGEFHTLCTSNENVRTWISNSLEYIFSNVEDLGGVFTITASENLTNCASHGNIKQCPRCSKRSAAEIIAEVNTAIETGVHRGNPDANVIAWDWGWQDDWAPKIISALPKSVWFMSVSEWSKSINRGDVRVNVGEYSISVVGPGPRATKHWSLAKQAGLKTIAKMQINNSWEFSAIPYLPVMDLIAQHCKNLQQHDVDGLMLSWTLGGYPSPNMQLVQQFEQVPSPSIPEALNALAVKYFGNEGAADARQAWTAFSNAFQEYPYHGGVVYRCPVQFGPANLLFMYPTNFLATMIGFPYDDIDGWRGPYPEDVFYNQFMKLSEGWKDGIEHLKQAVNLTPSEKKSATHDQLQLALAAQCHFKSVANQTRFTTIRNKLINQKESISEEESHKLNSELQYILTNEIELASQLYSLSKQDSRIGYEASNHYFYIPEDLIEKVINCHYILDHLHEY